MSDLVQWLGEQLDEDERIARAATRGPWVQSGIGDYGWTVDFGHPGSSVETADTEQGLADADFIAAHNPARVLREIDADRALLGDYTAAQEIVDAAACPDMYDVGRAQGLEGAVLRRAAAFDQRPGYREEWRP
ncbi:DUF6221 family protein [Streptomyces sp. NPDC056341]|uniref:DUF6221 family protein n=1 Tax=Streptomyces sp. NPDC056341 TaxID=3345788 RepID=UPI0035D88FA7